MRRADFFKSLVALPFMPSVLGRLIERPTGIMELSDGTLSGGTWADESWVVEFAGATFCLDLPTPGICWNTAPFPCRMGVDHLANGWKRLWVTRDGKTYVVGVKRGPEPRGITESLDMLYGEDLTAHPEWWPRRIR